MQPLAFLDPASLFVWVNFNAFLPVADMVEAQRGGSDDGRKFFEQLSEHCIGFYHHSPGTHQKFLESCPTKFRRHAYALFLTLWHEQRHFLDMLLTNFGARSIRTYFTSYVNLPPIVRAAEADGRLLLPLDRYSNATAKRMAGIRDPTGDLMKIASYFQSRRRYTADDVKIGSLLAPAGKYDGGHQLEALAFHAQIAMSQEILGYKMHAELLPECPPQLVRSRAFHSVQELLAASNIDVGQQRGGLEFINSNLMGPMMFASLMCIPASPGGLPEGEFDTSQAASYPASRLRMLTGYLRASGKTSAKSVNEGNKIVMAACRALWQQDYLEDLQADLQFEKGMLRGFKEARLASLGGREREPTEVLSDSAIEVFEQVHNLRMELFDELKKKPENVVDPITYAKKLAPRICPIVALALPDPVSVSGGSKFHDRVVLFKEDKFLDGKPIMSLAWAFAGLNKNSFFRREYQFDTRKLWFEFAQTCAPIGQLLVQGRRDGNLLGFLLQHAEKLLGELLRPNARVVYDSTFEWPQIDRSPNAWFDWLGVTTLNCDFTKQTVTRETSIMLSPWDFLRYPKLRAHLPKEFDGAYLPGGTEPSYWSYWLVHKKFAPGD